MIFSIATFKALLIIAFLLLSLLAITLNYFSMIYIRKSEFPSLPKISFPLIAFSFILSLQAMLSVECYAKILFPPVLALFIFLNESANQNAILLKNEKKLDEMELRLELHKSEAFLICSQLLFVGSTIVLLFT